MLPGLRKLVPGLRQTRSEAAIYRAMLRREADLGGRMFGPLPAGRRREFFCLDQHTWVWHEEWTNGQGVRQHKTTRYDVRPTGILKVQDGFGYQQLNPTEKTNFRRAVELYHQNITGRLYGHTTH